MSPARACSSCGGEFLGNGERCFECRTRVATIPVQDPASPLSAGRTFHGLEVLAVAGQGGMGVVYKARQTALDRLVALKILPPHLAEHPEFQMRFEREAKTMASLSHPHIVTVYDFGQSESLYFLVEEYVDGVRLADLIAKRETARREAVRIGLQICKALEYAHGEGVVHRDIKPGNILIDKKGRLKITDFGLAKLMDRDEPALALTQSRMAMGSAHYMAPEQVRSTRDVDHRVDIYAAGVVLYEVLTGELPIGRFDPPSAKGPINERLDAIVLKALQKEPDRRYQTAKEVRLDLERLLAPRSDPPPPRPSPPPRRRKRALFAGLLLLICAVSFLATMLLLPKSRPDGKKDGEVETSLLAGLLFADEDGPLGRRPVPDLPHLSRNPFLSRNREDIDRLLKYLGASETPLPAVPLTGGLVAAWPGCRVVALATPEGGRIEEEADRSWRVAHLWSFRRGRLLVLALGEERNERAAFVDLVRRLQDRLKIPPDDPPLRFENLLVDAAALPAGWKVAVANPLPLFGAEPPAREDFLRLQRHFDGVTADALRAVYCADFERTSGGREIRLEAAEFRDPIQAERHAMRAEKGAGPTKRIFLAGRTLAVLSTRRAGQEGFELLADLLHARMMGPPRGFDALLPTPEDLPFPHAKLVSESRDIEEIRRDFSLGDLPLVHACRIRFDPPSEILYLEIEDERSAVETKKRLSSSGKVLAKGRWICRVSSPDAGREKELRRYVSRKLELP